jgi:hypothetical protein
MSEQREPVYDPESVGLPDTVDPDSMAYDEAESVRETDGPQTPVSPYDRPQALDAPGIDGRATSLDARLAAELPDVGAVDDGREFEGRDGEVAGEVAAAFGESDLRDEVADDYSVGRLVAPSDMGSTERRQSLQGEDAGLAGGGASAEEAAMHLTDEDEELPE